MAHSTTRVSLFRRGPIWYLSYRLDGRRIKEGTGLEKKQDAELLRRDLEQKLVLGKLKHLKLREAPVRQVYREYLQHCVASFKTKRTIATDRSILKKFFRWAAVPRIEQLTTAKIMDFFAYRVKVDKLVPTSLRRNREALHAFFNFAKRKGYVSENPVTEVKAPRIPDRDIRYLKLGEIAGCLKAVEGDRLEGLIACAIYSGLRREELCWLTWEDVDLTEKKPLLRVRAKTVGDEQWIPKTKRNRLVPVHTSLVPYLATARMRAGEIPWVFTSPEGCRWDPDNLGHRLSKLMESVHLDWGFLEFRHTYGSQLAMKGMSIYKISKLMGNSARIAERHYAALQTEDLHDDINFGVEEEVPKQPAKPRQKGGPSAT